MEKEFEDYWKARQKHLIQNAPEHLAEERRNSSRMNTAGDWLLLAFPVVAMFIFMNQHFIQSELPNFLCGVVVCVVFAVIGELLKPYVTGKRRVGDIDKDIKQYYYEKYKRDGKLGDN